MPSKLVALIFGLSLFYSPLHAQKETSVITFGVIQNALLRNVQDVKHKNIIKNRFSPNIAGGCLIRKELKGRLYFNYGIYYSIQSWYYTANINGLLVDEKLNLSYLKIPLLLQYNIVQKPKYKLVTTVGPQLCFLIVEDGAFPFYIADPNSSNTSFAIAFDQKEVGGGYKPFTIEGAVSLGNEFKLSEKLFLNFHLRMDMSLVDIEKKSYPFIRYENSFDLYSSFTEPRKSTRAITTGALVGIIYKIR